MARRAGCAGAVLSLGVAFLVACESGEGTDTTPAAPATTATTAPGAESTTTDSALKPTSGLEGATTSPTSVPSTEHSSHLTAVRAAVHGGYDRVVFEFDGGPPGFSVSYVDGPLHEDGSGRVIEVDGAAVLDVRMERAASARLSGERVIVTYPGPIRFRPVDTQLVLEVVKSGDFEGVLSWAIGSRRRVPFKVTTLTGPGRLVVDLEHPQ